MFKKSHILLFAIPLFMSGCVGLSPEEIKERALINVTKILITEVRKEAAIGRATKLSKEITKTQQTPGPLVMQGINKAIEEDYQPVLNQIVKQMRVIQKAEAPDSPLNKKGLLKEIKLVIVDDDHSVNAWSDDNLIQPKIFVPSGFIVRSLQLLAAEQKKMVDEFFWLGYLHPYVQFLEFEEMIRFVLAHEATHIWLHPSGLPIREREIEADAWGVTISSSLSEALKFKAKVAKSLELQMKKNGRAEGEAITDPFDLSLYATQSGVDVLIRLYGASGVLSQTDDRQSLEERTKSVEEKYKDIFDKHLAKLTKGDVMFFELLNLAYKKL